MKFHRASRNGCAVVYRGASTFALALFLSGLGSAQEPPAQQEPPPTNQGQAQPPEQAPQAAPQPPAQTQQAPAKSPWTRDERPVVSRDTIPQGSANTPNASSARQSKPVPPVLQIPAGTVLVIRLNDGLSSDQNQIGDQFTGVLEQPIVANGWVVARRGQVVTGQVKSVQKAGRIKGVSHLGLELTDVTLVDGEQAPIQTELWRGTGGTSHGQDAATIGGGTLLGAIIGSAADWGRGAAIGAGIGAAAGVGTVLLTRGRPTVLPPETQLTFQLVDPITVDTTKSQQAFLPVRQADFGRAQRPRLRATGPYPYGPGPCGYYYPCYFAPSYAGVGWGYGWWGGPGFYGPRFYGPYGYPPY
jgi:hypothetical protein